MDKSWKSVLNVVVVAQITCSVWAHVLSSLSPVSAARPCLSAALCRFPNHPVIPSTMTPWLRCQPDLSARSASAADGWWCTTLSHCDTQYEHEIYFFIVLPSVLKQSIYWTSWHILCCHLLANDHHHYPKKSPEYGEKSLSVFLKSSATTAPTIYFNVSFIVLGCVSLPH